MGVFHIYGSVPYTGAFHIRECSIYGSFQKSIKCILKMKNEDVHVKVQKQLTEKWTLI